jgi:hypothetical protein
MSKAEALKQLRVAREEFLYYENCVAEGRGYAYARRIAYQRWITAVIAFREAE